MGTNGQAMLSASSSAEGADEGIGMSDGFPFVVLSGGDAAEGASVNPAFVAYAKRSRPPGRTAREALVLALAEVDEPETARDAGGETARATEASYGVTRSPFASVTTPVAPAVKAEPALAAFTKKEGATRRRPVLRVNASVAAPAAQPDQAPAPVQAVTDVTPPTVATAPPPAPPAEQAAGKLKISLRRAGPSAGAAPAPVPALPPADAPFLFGPVMDGSRSPLVPLPVASGEPGGAFVPPAHVRTRSPFPVAGGVPTGAGVTGLAPSAKVRPAVSAGRTMAARAGTRRVGFGRVAVVGLVLMLLGLAGYYARQSSYWPLGLKQTAVAGEAAPGGESAAAPTETRDELAARALAPSSSVSVSAEAHPTRPAPGAGFVGMLERLKITGVLQGEPVRAIIDGRLVQAGDLVDVAREVRLVGLDVGGRQLIFEDRTTARANVRY